MGIVESSSVGVYHSFFIYFLYRIEGNLILFVKSSSLSIWLSSGQSLWLQYGTSKMNYISLSFEVMGSTKYQRWASNFKYNNEYSNFNYLLYYYYYIRVQSKLMTWIIPTFFQIYYIYLIRNYSEKYYGLKKYVFI